MEGWNNVLLCGERCSALNMLVQLLCLMTFFILFIWVVDFPVLCLWRSVILDNWTSPVWNTTQHNWEGFHTWTALTRYTTAWITSADLTHFGFTELEFRLLYELHVFMLICPFPWNMKQTASYFKRENYYSEFNKRTEEKEKSNKMLMVTLKSKVKEWVPVMMELSWIINISYIIQTSPTSITATTNNVYLNIISFIDVDDTNKMKETRFPTESNRTTTQRTRTWWKTFFCDLLNHI